LSPDRGGRLGTGAIRQPIVQQDNIGGRAPGPFDCASDTTKASYDLDTGVGLEHRRERLSDDGMIFYDQDPDLCRVGLAPGLRFTLGGVHAFVAA